MKAARVLTIFALALVHLGQIASAATSIPISDASFEQGTIGTTWGYQTYIAGESMGGWYVFSGSVDLVGPAGGWAASDGLQSVDLSGDGPGRIQQDVVLPYSGTYSLSFALSANSWQHPDTKVMEVALGGETSLFYFTPTGNNPNDNGWITENWNVNLNAGTYTLSFASLEDSAYGPVIDNVGLSFEPVPEPNVTVIATAIFLVLFVLKKWQLDLRRTCG